MQQDPVLVVGTTPDYVAKINDTYPNAALFITDPRFRDDHRLKNIEPSAILFSPLDSFDETFQALVQHLSAHHVNARGIACFDCESLVLASRLAHHLGKPFPPPEAILRSRNKYEARKTWSQAGILSPRAIMVSELNETLEFFHLIENDIVLKPISGSGSELVFRCVTEEEVKESVGIMKSQLPRRRSNPLFTLRSDLFSGQSAVDPCNSWIAEEFISGDEFSCDFVLENGRVIILRETGKIKATDETFGSVLAYRFPPQYPEVFSLENLCHVLRLAAESLGYTWGHFMVDYIIHDNFPCMIEMTPRPGGDSIPDLIKIATGRDLLGMHMDIMSGRPIPSNGLPKSLQTFFSVNIYAKEEGRITCLDTCRIISQPWVKDLFLKKDVGDRIKLPPDDYDNRLIGYCVITKQNDEDFLFLANRLQELLRISVVP